MRSKVPLYYFPKPTLKTSLEKAQTPADNQRYLREDWMEVPDLLGDLSRNLIGPHRMFVRLFPEPEIGTSEDEGEGYSKPHAQQSQHGGEWYLQGEVM